MNLIRWGTIFGSGDSTLGSCKRRLRSKLGWTQTLFLDGESNESNESSPSITRVPRIMRFLGYDPSPSPISLAEQLRHTRKRLGSSQGAMARQLGVDPTTLRRWEQGRARPNRRSMEIIQKVVLGINRKCGHKPAHFIQFEPAKGDQPYACDCYLRL